MVNSYAMTGGLDGFASVPDFDEWEIARILGARHTYPSRRHGILQPDFCMLEG